MYSGTVLFVLICNLVLREGSSVCCPEIERIYYEPIRYIDDGVTTDCSKVPGARYHKGGLCLLETCVDLKDHRDRWFCAVGDCNVFGCNCDGGCIQLDRWGRRVVAMYEKRYRVVKVGHLFEHKYRQHVLKGSRPWWEITGFAISSKGPIQNGE